MAVVDAPQNSNHSLSDDLYRDVPSKVQSELCSYFIYMICDSLYKTNT